MLFVNFSAFKFKSQIIAYFFGLLLKFLGKMYIRNRFFSKNNLSSFITIFIGTIDDMDIYDGKYLEIL